MRVIAHVEYSLTTRIHEVPPIMTVRKAPKAALPGTKPVRRQALQSRSRATTEAILQASAHVLQAGGLAAFNTNQVAEKAGVSIGSLYQYYPNKEALLMALSVLHTRELVASLSKAMLRTPAMSLEKTVRTMVAVALEQQYASPRLAAALDYAERHMPPSTELQAERQMLLAQVIATLGAYRLQLQGNLREMAIDLKTIVQAMVDGAAARNDPLNLALRKRIERAVLGYLLGPNMSTP